MTLVIRRQQFAAMAAASLAEFKRSAARHVAHCWPAEFDALGTEGAAALIDEALARGRELRFAGQRDTVRYLDLLLLLQRQGASAEAVRAAVDAAWRLPGLDASGKVQWLWQRAKAQLPAARSNAAESLTPAQDRLPAVAAGAATTT